MKFPTISPIRALVSIAALLATHGCADSGPRDDARMTPSSLPYETPPGISRDAVEALEALKERNKNEGVGLAHNKYLDAFRTELRRPGKVAQNLCTYVEGFVLDKLQRGDYGVKDSRVGSDIVRAGLRTDALCASQASRLSARLPARRQSSQADALSDEIQAAIDYSINRYDLAQRLIPVHAAAAGLGETDKTIVEATVSVALNSWEYWETNYAAFEQEIIAEYRDCGDAIAMSEDLQSARDSCMKGGGDMVDATPSAAVVRVRIPTATRCGPSLRDGFKHIVRSDASGAFTGGFAAAFTGVGIVGGALVGGASHSIFAAGENAFKTLMCIYAK